MGHFDWPIAKNILKLCPLPPKIKVTYFYTIFYCRRVKPVSGMREQLQLVRVPSLGYTIAMEGRDLNRREEKIFRMATQKKR
jgi:hypothetical protein